MEYPVLRDNVGMICEVSYYTGGRFAIITLTLFVQFENEYCFYALLARG